MEGVILSRDIVETYVPVMLGGQFLGAIEIYHDVSGQITSLESLVAKVSLYIVLASIIFSATLIFVYIKVKKSLVAFEEAKDTLGNALKSIADEKIKTDTISSAINDGISIQDRNFMILYQNPKQIKRMGENVGEKCYKAYEEREGVCEGCH